MLRIDPLICKLISELIGWKKYCRVRHDVIVAIQRRDVTHRVLDAKPALRIEGPPVFYAK